MKAKKLSVKFRLQLASREILLYIDYEAKVVVFSIAPTALDLSEIAEVSDFLKKKKASDFNFDCNE